MRKKKKDSEKFKVLNVYLYCPGANGFADLVPNIFLACPGGIGLAPCPPGLGGFGGRGGAAHATNVSENIKLAK